MRAPLANPIQAVNIAMAWRVIQLLQNKFAINKGEFENAIQRLNLGPARFEKLSETRNWYFDGAHNLEAVQALKQSIKMINTTSDPILILAMMRDKVRPEVMKEFSELKNIYYYSLGLERAATFDDIKIWLPKANSFPADNDHQSFLNDLDSELVIFAGSFYFYNTVRDWVSSIA
jgi:dihydrofolate synthase/folylpolyglutamate synthase